MFIHPWFIAQKWGLQEEIFEEFQTVLPESLTGYGTTAPSSGAKRTAGAGLLQKEGQRANVKIKDSKRLLIFQGLKPRSFKHRTTLLCNVVVTG